MPGTLLLDDLRSSIQDQLHQYVDGLGQQTQPAVVPVQPVQPVQQQAPDQADILQQLQQHAQAAIESAQQQAQPALQVLGGAQQAAGGALAQVGQQRDQVAQQLQQHVDSLTQPVQQGLQTLGGPPPPTQAPAQQPAELGAPPTQNYGPIDSSSAKSFAQSFAPYAQYAAQKLGVDPSWVTAMAASESNYGKAQGNELFGIKALPGQAGTSMMTHEGEYGGTNVAQTFASYDSPLDAVNAYVDLLKNHYPGALNAPTLTDFVHGLKTGGYFTAAESEYRNILDSIANRPDVQAGLQAVGGAASALGTTARGALDTAQTAMNQSQFGDPQLTSDEAYAACGPAAAVRFAERFGRNPTLREATDLAKQVGWTQQGGMAGITSEQQLMTNLGVDTKIVGRDWSAYAREATTGNPVTISTPGHYFFADGYNAESGAFHVGRSGMDLKGGAEWMTPAQMENLMGTAQGALFANNPTVPAKGSSTTSNEPITMGANQPARAPLYADQQQQAPTPIQSAQDVARDLKQAAGGAAQAVGQRAEELNQPPFPGATEGIGAGVPTGAQVLGGAAQAVGSAASALGTGVQDVYRQGRTPEEQAASNQQYQQDVLAAAEAMRRKNEQPVTLGGVAENAWNTLIQNPPSAGITLGQYQDMQTAKNQWIEQNNPLNNQPVPLVAGLTTAVAQQLTDPLMVATFGPTLGLGRAVGAGAAESVTAAAGERLAPAATRFVAQVADRFASGAITGGLQNALFEAEQPNATPQSVGTALLVGAGLGGAIDAAAPAVNTVVRRIGQQVIDRAAEVRPQLVEALRARQPAQAEVGFAAGLGPGRAEAPAAPETTRMYHGTGADFPTPEGGRFDPNGLFGPGYYLTTSPEVAGGTVSRGQIGIDPATGRTSTLNPATGKFDTYMVGRGELQAPGYAQQRTNLTASDVVEVASRASDDARANRGYFGSSVAGELHDIAVRVGQGRTPAAAGEQSMLAILSRDVPNPERYVREIAPEIYARGGNVRAVDVPQSLRLLNADTTVAAADVSRVGDAIARQTGDRNDARSFVVNVRSQNPQGITGEGLQTALRGYLDVARPEVAVTERPQAVNAVLADAGFDGITYQGGKRIPMTDAQGAPIQHQATVIFPESLPKIRNAISGRQGGQAQLPFSINVAGGVAGGVAGNVATPENATPEDRLKNIGAGATAGLVGTRLLTRTLERRPGLLAATAEGTGGFRAPERPTLEDQLAQARTRGPAGGGAPPPTSPELDKLNAMYDGKKPAPAASIPDRLQAVSDSLTRAFTDRQVDINHAQQRYAANLGRPLRADEMAAELQRLASDPVAQVKVDEGLKPAIQSVGSDYPSLRNYVTLRSNVEIADNLAARTGKPAVGTERLFSGGLTRDESVKALQDLQAQLGPERFARVQAAADQVTAFNQSLRQRLVDAGVLDRATADQLEAQYPNWAKTRILDYMADPAGGQGAGTKLGLNDRGLREYTLQGTTRAREDPVASTVAYAHQVERMALKNEAFNAFLKIDQAGASPMLREVPQSYSPTKNEVTMIGFVDGQKQKYVTDNKALGAAINGAGVLSTPEWTSAWQKVFRSLATSRNPVFLAGNAALDIPTYVLRSSVREGGPQALPRILGELARGYGDAFQGLLQGEYRGEATARFLKGGGGQSGFFTGGEGQTKQAVAEMQRKNVFQINGVGDLGRLTKDLLTLHPVEALGERIELGPRVAAMRLAERRGANPTQAIIDGRTVTVDFSQGGTVTKYLNNFIPFFNVGFQGPAQIARAFHDNKLAFAATVGTLIGMPSVAAEVWNRSDAQRAKDYADVPQYVKDQGIVVMLPGDAPVDAQGNRKPMYAVIKLREWAPFAAIAREGTARVMGDDSRSWQDMASSIGAGLSPTQATSAAQAGTEPLSGIPILPAAAQLEYNKDFFRNRTIVTQRADQNASALSQGLAPALQQVMNRAGANVEIRPSAIDFLIRNQGAGVGGAVLGASDLAAQRASDIAGPTGLPVVGGLAGRFVGGQTGEELQQARDQTLTPAGREILRTNGITLTPGAVSGSVNQIPLKIEEETRYQQLANQYIDEAIQRTAASRDFATKTQVGKQSMIDQAMQAARSKAGNEVLNTIPAAEKQRRLRTKSTAA